MKTSTEGWRPVVGYENLYDISDVGRIRVALNARGQCRKPGRILTVQYGSKGYPQYSLCKNGRSVTRPIHSLIAQAFIGERPSGFEVAHLDGDKRNSVLLNLIYTNPKDNASHKKAHGTNLDGEKGPANKLSTKDAILIRAFLPVRNCSYAAIARLYRVDRSTIRSIGSRRNWKHLGPELQPSVEEINSLRSALCIESKTTK